MIGAIAAGGIGLRQRAADEDRRKLADEGARLAGATNRFSAEPFAAGTVVDLLSRFSFNARLGAAHDFLGEAVVQAADDAGFSLDEMRARLAADHTRLAALLEEAAARSSNPGVFAENWRRLHRELLIAQGRNEIATGDLDPAAADFRAALGLTDEPTEPRAWSETARLLAITLHLAGSAGEAEGMYRAALATADRDPATSDAVALGCADGLGALMWSRGNAAGVEELRWRALSIRERTLGAEHPETLRSMDQLAAALAARGDVAGAGRLLDRALRTRTSALGPAHDDTLRNLNDLAALFERSGDLASAEAFHRQALDAQETAFGPDDARTLRTLTNLANLLAAKGDRKTAEALCRRALVTQERTLGPDDPDTLRSVNNLAVLLRDGGDAKNAESLFRRALTTMERTLGPDHPDTIRTAFNFSLMRSKSGKWKEALALAERAELGARKRLPEGHPARQTYEAYAMQVRTAMSGAAAKSR